MLSSKLLGKWCLLGIPFVFFKPRDQWEQRTWVCDLESGCKVSQGTGPCRSEKAASLTVVSPSSGLLGFLLTLSALKLKSLVAPGPCAAWLLLAQVREEVGAGVGRTPCSQSWLICTESVPGAGPPRDPTQLRVCAAASSSCSRPGRRGSPPLLSPDVPTEHERFYKQTTSGEPLQS